MDDLDEDFMTDPIEEEYAKVFSESKKLFDDDDFFDTTRMRCGSGMSGRARTCHKPPGLYIPIWRMVSVAIVVVPIR